MTFDLILRGGRVYDGTGNPWTKLDVGITGGQIAKLGRMGGAKGQVEIDASGLAISPGFIDVHVHSDLLCTRPETHKVKVLQGVTTELFGQDGLSAAPVSEETKPLWQEQLRGLDGDIGEWPWNSVEEYLGFLEDSDMASNAAYLVPHGAVRSLVMGFEGRRATAEEARRMRELVEEGMHQGAVGLSTGLVYPPNTFSEKEELVEICRGAAANDGCFAVHVRNESNRILEALDEIVDVARHSNVRLHISHFKVIGQANRDKFETALERLEAAREEGLEITFDQYPYTAGSTVLNAILPPWMHSGGTGQMLERLSDPVARKRIKEDFETSEDFENWVRSCGWENIVVAAVASEKNMEFEGRSIAEIAGVRGTDPAEAAFDLLLEEKGSTTMIAYWGEDRDIAGAMRHPYQMVASDGIFGGKPHPRLTGTFPRVLGRYVRDRPTLTGPEAVRRMTGAPAQLLRLQDRGLIREGYAADLVVFDPDTVADEATYEDPLEPPSGIRYVFVNGRLAVREGAYTGATPGQVIRSGD